MRMTLQRPGLPGTLQARHRSSHAVLQQRPSTQKPESHSSVHAHFDPSGFYWIEPNNAELKTLIETLRTQGQGKHQ